MRNPFQSGSSLPAERNRAGMTLVLVLLVLGFAAAITLYTQASTVSALRLARLRSLQNSLRLAASDGAWYFVHNQARSAISEPKKDHSSKLLLPSGIETEVRFSKVTGVNQQILTQVGNAVPNSDVFMVESSATASNKTESVYCFMQKSGDDKIHVLGWLETR